MSVNGEPEQPTILRELDTRYRAPLMAFFMRRVGNRSDAEDLTQETFARLINSDTFAPAERPTAFVFRVASNLLSDRRRLEYRVKQFPLSEFDPELLERLSKEFVEEREPERVLMGRQSLDEVYKCLDELGERTKSIFILVRLEGMKQKEIAALYGMGLSSVEKYLMRATIHLATRFEPGTA